MDVLSTPVLFYSVTTGFCFLVGVLIGTCGIGGILIIPFLVYVASIDIHIVIPACMAGFIVNAIFANYAYAKRGSIRWDKALFISIGAAPGAYLGSVTVLAVSSLVLEVIMATLVIGSGLRAFLSSSSENRGLGIHRVPNGALILVGLAVGYGSSLSGTGGPLLLIPTLLLLDFPIMVAVGLSMAIQIPIAPFATLGHVIHGTIDWALAVPVAVGLSSGVLIGARIAHKISAITMQRTVAVALLGCGAMIVAQFFV